MDYYLSKKVGGEVVCGCAEECCLYPWPDPDGTAGGPYYPPEDLPDTLLVNGVDTYTHVIGTYYFEVTIGADFYRIRPGLVADGAGRYGYWVQETPGGLAGAGLCLIDPAVIGGIEDEFPDTLTVNGTTAITRTPAESLCIWTDDTTLDLDYGISNPYKFSLNGVAKTDPQDSPVGSYGADTVT